MTRKPPKTVEALVAQPIGQVTPRQAWPGSATPTGSYDTPRAHLLDSLLQGTDAIYKADGPVTAFFDRNPQRVYEQVVKKLRNVFKSLA